MAKKQSVKPKKANASSASSKKPQPSAKKADVGAKKSAAAAKKPAPPAKKAAAPVKAAKAEVPKERPQPKTLSSAGKRDDVAQVDKITKKTEMAKVADSGASAPAKGRNKAFEAPKIDLSEDPEVQKLQQKWLNLFEKSRNQEAAEYNMTQSFEAKTAINHKLLGWGYILSNQHDRLEVLFKDGVRFLISNYKRP